MSAGGAPLFTLRQLAHARTGDKGDLCNIAVVAWRPEFYPLLVEQVTEQAVSALFSHRRPRSVRRYLLPRLHAMNLVLDGAIDGGVTDSLNLDAHGKSLSFLLLRLPVRVPEALQAFCRGQREDRFDCPKSNHGEMP